MTTADPRAEPGISAATLRKVERASSALATRSVALMDERLPWFRSLPAQQRSWVTLVAQAGIAGYVGWIGGGLDGFKLTEAVFGSAPRELARSVTLRRTVELVRIAISVAEEHLPALAATPEESAALADSLLRYSREVAFSAAGVYAAAAESRGAWDQRLEALVVDSIVRGDGGDSLASRAAALNWDFSGPVVVVVGSPPSSGAPAAGRIGVGERNRQSALIAGIADQAAPLDVSALAGLHGDRLILILSAPTADALHSAVGALLETFGDGPVVRGPIGTGLAGAMTSARLALSGLRAVLGWPNAPRGIDADHLLPERLLAGDPDAREHLHRTVFAPLVATGDALPATLDAYLAAGRALEPAARDLFVHVNTVRYRLRRVAELTGLDPMSARDSLTLQLAMMTGRLDAEPEAGRRDAS
ncbi:PucR C-terminal helix-turn-helix domain-containing protein [Nakamurella panacisegetis]|uniref:PucR C-terminal helix-turn-helix domain-containing protein n=1 Tax=Nakamurella panacisegetis TaxID=1090615 RepID=A0A1H0SR20_9ACTN|nr:helix-turn-helix domain-containing protein [Nakamurella panacisegetis]SDP44191.1 PucR C-terminal helix-turn-helix domain-containing protein [Nakamurella panacisegetis]